jgi:hypothetical protein
MPKKVLLDNEWVTIWYHGDTKIIHHQFHQYIYGEKFRECLNTGTEMMKKHGAKKWLSDDRNNAAMSKEDMAWTETDWYPRTIAAGWKFWAIVLPKNIIGKMNMDYIIKRAAAEGLTIRPFTDPDEAMEWLESQ